MAHPSQQPDARLAGPASFSDMPAPQDDSDTDLALGFECANPWLQIESWAQDAAGRPGVFS